jgi:UDPglucose--hexose-1-phosphate uridylyltransferase
MTDFYSGSHRRRNPLTGEWILVSPHRTQRPWQGQVEALAANEVPEYDPQCYMCPGNTRARGEVNPPYHGVFVFDNDYPALTTDPVPRVLDDAALLVAAPERGRCRVLCFSPKHNLTLPDLSIKEIGAVIDAWAQETTELGAALTTSHVQIFENRGALMGASNPHPHCQIWATESLPNEPLKELHHQREYSLAHSGKCLLCSYLQLELARKERMVLETRDFVVLVPFWAIWPFETLLLPKRHAGRLPDLSAAERSSLAEALQKLTRAYNAMFGVSFPYSMGFHQQPPKTPAPGWHLHAHYYPPLLRSAAIRKFMVGFELLGMPQRDITPESAADRLRTLAGRL